MHFVKIFLYVLVILSWMSCSKSNDLLYEENFESKSTEGWLTTDSTAWGIVDDNGNLCYALKAQSNYKPLFRSPLNISLIENLVVTDFTLELDLKQTGKVYGHQDLCLFFGYQDSANFYYVHLGLKADPHSNSIFIVNEAPRTSIALERTDSTPWTSDWHHVKLIRHTETGDIGVYFDDMETPVMKASDKTFLWGQLGIGSFDDTGYFDNIKVWGKLRAR